MIRHFREKKLVLATRNEGKIQEFKHLFGKVDFKLLSAKEFGDDEPEESENTFIGNALIKARETSKLCGCVCLADDSGLCVENLNGKPGIKSADWSINELGKRDFALGISKVIEALKEKDNHIWNAYFNCALVLYWPDGHYEQVEGKINGEIVWPSRGKNGHGYDPIFLPTGYKMTFGEMDRWDKNKISHRGKAMEKLLLKCFSYGE